MGLSPSIQIGANLGLIGGKMIKESFETRKRKL